MTALATDSWRDLFETAAGGQPVRLAFCEVRRAGTPLLYLPVGNRGAVRALSLYPAQSARARLARRLLALALRFGLSVGLKRVELQISDQDPFGDFLRKVTATTSLPAFAVLAGNPHAPGRRFVFLLLSPSGGPQAVVKAAVTETARALLAHEENFLRAAPTQATGLPAVRDGFESPRGRAFALDFVEGNSPLNADASALKALLTSWIQTDRTAVMSRLVTWQRLAPVLNESAPAISTLANATFHPVLMHGDFAPWNIKVRGDHWTVLDWERGDMEGVPTWDWFHFELQPALLVRREAADELFARCERLLRSPAFLAYAEAAGVGVCRRELLLAYLANCLRVTKQTEGREQLLELEKAAAAAWFGRPAQ